MQRYNRQPFSPRAEFQCVKPFVMSGKAYVLGERIDTANVEERRLRQMYEARMIEPVPEQSERAPKVQRKPEAPPPREPQPASPAGLQAVHKGFGRWYLIDGNGTESGPMSKKEAEQVLKTSL